MLVIAGSILLHSCSRSHEENPEHTALLDTILDRANSLVNSGEIKRAEKYLDSAFATIPSPGTIDLWRKYEHKVSFYLLYQKDVERATSYADSMIEVLADKSKRYPSEYAKSIFARSEVLMEQKRYTEAFNSYYEGKRFASKYLDSCDSYEFSYKLGLATYRQAKYLDAIPFLKQSYAEGGACTENDSFEKTFSARQRNLNTVALCFDRSKMPDSAVVYYLRALDFIKNNAHKHPGRDNFISIAKGVILGNLGGAYAALNKDSLAERYLLASIRINDRPRFDIRDAQTAKIKLALLYIKNGRINESEKLLDELQAYLAAPDNNNSPVAEHIKLHFYKVKWTLYDKTSQTEGAYQYALKYSEYKDSLENVDKGLENVDMELVFKDAEQRHKLELLNKDHQLSQAFMIAAVIIASLLLIVLGGVLFNLKNSRRLNKKMAEQNKQMQSALNALQQSQDENTSIIKVIAHDLRSPMAATVSITSLLLEDESLRPDSKEMLEMMRSSNLHSLDMIDDLLNMNTTATGLKKELVDIQPLLYECVEMLKFKAEEKNQQIILQSKAQTLYINREKIWRVMNNLIINAIKFSPAYSEINVTMSVNANVIRIGVKDQGIGVPEEMKNKLFDMFTDARRAGTAGEKSFGMGLAISRQIIDAHGGRIWFERNPDTGTTFFLEMPVGTPS
jgi:signal transduction histidine kinase